MSKLFGNLTCPKCKGVTRLEIPGNTCVPFYTCSKCNELISANKKCCVFCEYSDQKCPVSK